MSSRTRLQFPIQTSPSGETIALTISDPSKITADNLALATWGSSEVLANTLHKLNFDLTGPVSGPGNATATPSEHHVIPVLEIGAGTGLVGMTAAAVWHTHAMLTDLDPILPNIAANISLNKETVSQHNGSLSCGLLDWSNPSSLTLRPPRRHPQGQPSHPTATPSTPPSTSAPARIILAADTIYSAEHPGLLLSVLSSRLERSKLARFVICYPLRIGYLDFIRELWEKLEGLGLESKEEGREKLGEEWEEEVEYEWCVFGWK
jgi:hypothetical protein